MMEGADDWGLPPMVRDFFVLVGEQSEKPLLS